MKKISEVKKKRMLDWFKKHPQKDKGRRKSPAMTNLYGSVLFSYKNRRKNND